MKHDNIPVIDLAPLLDGSDPESVAQAIHRASREIGFIYAANHGIADDVTASARNAALEFFRLPHDIKDAIRVNEYHRGFLGRGGAKMQDDAKADLKESFIWGLEASQDGNLPPCPLRGPNQWPASPCRTEARSHGIFRRCALSGQGPDAGICHRAWPARRSIAART